jgi:hypothetical protein
MLVDAISWFRDPNPREIRSEQLHRVYRIETLIFEENFRESCLCFLLFMPPRGGGGGKKRGEFVLCPKKMQGLELI